MHNLLLSLFSLVCGENPNHLWEQGGQLLPCCQRCAGLYAGALAAAVSQLLCRPRLSQTYCWMHGLCLAQLGLFIFPWMPDSPFLRMDSGVLFGFGVVAFLWPAVGERFRRQKKSGYGTGFASTLILTPLVARCGGALGAFLLTSMVVLGAFMLALLSAVNIASMCRTLPRWGETPSSPNIFRG